MPSRRFKARENKKNAIAVLIVVVFAAVVFSINSIGRFIAQNVISPLAQAGDKKTQTVSFSLDALEVYALGLPIENKEKVLTLGGAGFELNETALYSCYADKSTAETLADKHTLTLIPLYADKLSVRLTGQQTEIEPIKNAMNLLRSCLLEILDVSAHLELADATRTQVKAKIELNLKDLNTALEEIKKTQNSTVKQLTMTLQCYITALNEAQSAQSEQFLPCIKTLACTLCREYLSFASTID